MVSMIQKLFWWKKDEQSLLNKFGGFFKYEDRMSNLDTKVESNNLDTKVESNTDNPKKLVDEDLNKDNLNIFGDKQQQYTDNIKVNFKAGMIGVYDSIVILNNLDIIKEHINSKSYSKDNEYVIEILKDDKGYLIRSTGYAPPDKDGEKKIVMHMAREIDTILDADTQVINNTKRVSFQCVGLRYKDAERVANDLDKIARLEPSNSEVVAMTDITVYGITNGSADYQLLSKYQLTESSRGGLFIGDKSYALRDLDTMILDS